MSYKAILSTKIAVVVLGLLLIFFINVKYQQYKNQKAIETEKQLIIDQINEQEKKNKDLSDSLSLLTSQDYKERMARQQLNLKKDGEIVYNFSDVHNDTSTSQSSDPSTNVASANAKKWWNYFFNN